MKVLPTINLTMKYGRASQLIMIGEGAMTTIDGSACNLTIIDGSSINHLLDNDRSNYLSLDDGR